VNKKTMEDVHRVGRHDTIVHDCLTVMEREPDITREDALIAMVCLLAESRAELFKKVVRLKVYEPINIKTS